MQKNVEIQLEIIRIFTVFQGYLTSFSDLTISFLLEMWFYSVTAKHNMKSQRKRGRVL